MTSTINCLPNSKKMWSTVIRYYGAFTHPLCWDVMG